LSYHNRIKFTTKDKDNDGIGSRNCAARQKGGWWYKFCDSSNLNGLYLKAGEKSDSGINWRNLQNDLISMKKTEMKTRPVKF
jgi:ficolin